MKVNLEGKVALVTGAGRGIGKAIADTLAANGARVIYSDVDHAAAQQSAAATGSRAVRLDVTDAPELDAVVAQTVADFGRIDILVNNAGVNTARHRVTIDEFPKEEWDRILNVDLT